MHLQVVRLFESNSLVRTAFCNISSLSGSRVNKQTRNNPISNNPSRSLRLRRTQMSRTPLDAKFEGDWPKVVFFGDSITRRSRDPDFGCWSSWIAHRLGSYFEVDVRGFDGYNSKWALELMPQLFPRKYLDKVELFIPFFGHNDSWDQRIPLHVECSKYEENMRAILDYLKQNGLDSSKVLLITPTWYHAEACDKHSREVGLPEHGKELNEARKYSEAIKRIGHDLDIPVLDFFELSCKYEPLEGLFHDGVHFNREGARFLYNSLMPMIEDKLEKRYGKPIADIWHTYPVELHPEVRPAFEAYRKNKESTQAKK